MVSLWDWGYWNKKVKEHIRRTTYYGAQCKVGENRLAELVIPHNVVQIVMGNHLLFKVSDSRLDGRNDGFRSIILEQILAKPLDLFHDRFDG